LQHFEFKAAKGYHIAQENEFMALKSMTGYGSAQVREKGVLATVEILSVNRKHLDINIILPRHLSRFDPDIRKLISSAIFRGHVVVRISCVFEESSPLAVRPNLALAKELYRGWQEIARALGIPAAEILSLSLLEKEPELFSFEETSLMESLQPILLKAVEDALKPFLEMREREGKLLESEISAKIKKLKDTVREIEANSTLATVKLREKLLSKLKEVLPEIKIVDDRLLKEIAIFAEKVDIAEEILRLDAHLDQFIQLLEEPKNTPGKTADFILQELNREINTIGSKSLELAITRLVVHMKSELERIREQMQNVE
jgi:uncharacterized protein (TIGR00255 family)